MPATNLNESREASLTQASINNSSQVSGITDTVFSATTAAIIREKGLEQDSGNTTVFADDSVAKIVGQPSRVSIDSKWLSINDTQLREQDLKDFLAKPIILMSGNFSVTDTYSFLNSLSIPYAPLTSANGAIWREKLRGFFGIRFDMRFKLVVNANRFQQGRYILGWMPLCGAAASTSNLKNVATNNLHMATLVQRTTVPHLEIDLATETSVELDIPYASVLNYYPLNAVFNSVDTGSLGWINLYPYSPLVAPEGSTVATYTVYMSLHNVRLFGAAAPQSGVGGDAELANKVNGPVSSVASNIAKSANVLSLVTPLVAPPLTAVMITVGWVSEAIANVARVWGYSKPSNGGGNSNVALLNNPAHNTVDGDSAARSLGLISKPGVVTPVGVSPTSIDEMDLKYIASKYAWFSTFNWTTSSSGVLANISTGPNWLINAGGAQHFTPLAFVARHFLYWRGSRKFRFKFVKTQFHSGRLCFAFYPTDEAGSFTSTASEAYVNRVIVDIRDTNVVELVIPYISSKPWMWHNTGAGSLVVSVVDALVAPDSVSNTVTILVETAGGDDIEFAMPYADVRTVKVVTPQSLDPAAVRMDIGSSGVDYSLLAATSACIGERVLSVRSLLKRYSPIITDKSASSTVRMNNTRLTINPDWLFVLESVDPTFVVRGDNHSSWIMCYGMWSGGVRFKNIIDFNVATTTSPAVANNMVTANLVFRNTDQNNPFSTGVADAYLNNFTGLVMQQHALNNTIEVEIPQYSTVPARCVADMWGHVGGSVIGLQKANSYTAYNLEFKLPASTVMPGTPIANYDLHNVYRACADDTSLMVFISVPPMSFGGTSYFGAFY